MTLHNSCCAVLMGKRPNKDLKRAISYLNFMMKSIVRAVNLRTAAIIFYKSFRLTGDPGFMENREDHLDIQAW